jgi:hypothetical protein
MKLCFRKFKKYFRLFRHIIIGELGPNLSKADKQEKWNEIFLKLNAMRANLPDFKVRL